MHMQLSSGMFKCRNYGTCTRPTRTAAMRNLPLANVGLAQARPRLHIEELYMTYTS